MHYHYRLAGLALVVAVTAAAGPALNLEASHAAPQPVGAAVRFTATATGVEQPVFRFRYREFPGDFRTIRDFSPGNSLEWTFTGREGLFEVEATVRDLENDESATATMPYRIEPVMHNGVPVVNSTDHPLVLLYSAPPCPLGRRMRVEFSAPTVATHTTSTQECDSTHTMNFLIGGLRADTEYTIRHVVENGGARALGPALKHHTGLVSVETPAYHLVVPPAVDPSSEVMLHGPLFPNRVTATDLAGNLIWYYPGAVSILTRSAGGGAFLGIANGPGGPWKQVLREFDLLGTTLRETNAGRVNEQLASMGNRPINAFHHEAWRLPDGRFLALAGVEQILTDVQGPGDVDVVSDMVLMLDQDLQVVWAWDAFDHMDTARLALQGELCSQGSCPPLTLAPDANDWLHGNSLHMTPDGNILLSLRHQDWVVKIDAATGEILWRLGPEGDFALASGDESEWFSHQHDAGFASNGLLMVLDNGNARAKENGEAHSRGQAWVIDETNRVARPVVNAGLGVFSFALGTAQLLPNGEFQFGVGWHPDGTSSSVATDAAGTVTYALHGRVPEYRTFRLPSLYAGQ